jgi:hypothetical protein
MEPLGDVGHVEPRFGPFEDSVICWYKIGAPFAMIVPQAQKLFWTQPMELLDDVGHVKSHFGLFVHFASICSR